MENELNDVTKSEAAVVEERTPWHKPTIERLSVALDTANGTGSGPDFGGRTSALS